MSDRIRDIAMTGVLLMCLVVGACVDDRLKESNAVEAAENIVTPTSEIVNTYPLITAEDLKGMAETGALDKGQEINESPIHDPDCEDVDMSPPDAFEEEGEIEEDNGLIYLGEYEITAYEWTGNPCANGNYPTEGYTAACNSLPFGTVLYIEGVGYRTIEDRGAEWHSDFWVDVYMGDEWTCNQFGRQYLNVYIVE